MPSQINIKKQDQSIIQSNGQEVAYHRAETEYDRDKFPPDMDEARNHGVEIFLNILQRATKCAKPIDDGPQEICQCCGLNTYNEQLMVCHDRKALSFLGTGFPLFFDFLLWTKRILILAFIIYGLYAILSNGAGGDCINALNSVQGQLETACCTVNHLGNTVCQKS